MAQPFNADRYLTKRWDYDTPAIIYYVRPGGDDNNSGLSPAAAFATLERALHFMAISDVNLPIIIDITGMTISSESVLNLGGNTLGGLSFDLDLTATAPNNFFSRRSHQIRSELSLVTALNVTGQSFDAVTGLLTLTVNDALVANALRGSFAVSTGTLGQYGTIRSNTGGAGPNTIQVANIVGITAPVSVYQPGATLQFGDPANFFEQAIYLNALSDWSLHGLRIQSNGPKATSLSVWPEAPVDLTLCDIAGLEINSGGGQVTIDSCFVHDFTFAQDGGSISAQQSYFRALTFLCHGSGGTGLNEWIGVIIENSSPFGGGNVESAYNFELQNALITGGTGQGVQALSGVSRIIDSTIQNSTASGIGITNNATLYLDNITGTGNTGFGVEATNGAVVRRTSACTITGTTNDISVGGAGGFAWSAIPITDIEQLARIGT